MRMDKKPLSGKIIKDLQKAQKKEYEDTDNPSYLLGAFKTAYYHNLPIPKWVLDRLYVFFVQYSESKGDVTLDKIFGFKRGPGQIPAFKAMEIHKQNFFLMWTIYRLEKTLGISNAAAALVAGRFVNSMREDILKLSTVKKEYSKKWKDIFQNPMMKLPLRIWKNCLMISPMVLQSEDTERR
jgi:hypothetical protein